MKAVFFQHMSSNPPATLRKVMEKNGITCQVIHTAYEDIFAFDALAPDILCVLGGSPGVYQQNEYPFLKQEQLILEKRLAADRPTLGICLGAQLMAAALGEEAYRGEPGQEIGWFDLTLHEAAKGTSAQHFQDVRVMQWHGDTFNLPKDATLLASSDKYRNQIFSYGRNTMGFQCHIEVTADILADWYVHDAGTFMKHPDMHEVLRKDTGRYIADMTKATEAFMKEWLAQVLPDRLLQEKKQHA